MASSMSPDQYGKTPQQLPYSGGSGNGGGGGSDQDKSPLSSLNLGFLKSLTEKRTTRDGQPPKRRGPKPDSKPALTRRQELNRQAQRTHRERKELYIKALEDEVLRLKEIFSNVSQDKDKIAEENRQLKQILAQNGIPLSHYGDDMVSNPSAGYTSSASVSGHSYGHNAYTPPMTSTTAPSVSPSSHGPSHSHSHGPPPPLPQMVGGQQLRNMQAQNKGRGVDFEQAGIDFVLTLEKPCMNHMPWLLERSSEMGGEPCGHALMASCPPAPFPELTPDIPFGYSNVNGDLDSQQRTWEVSKGSLSALLDLSKKLNLDGEVTPVMAWGMVIGHPRVGELRAEDFNKLTDELKDKVRCYGFGAVMEEFEVRDALENVFCSRPEVMMY